MNLNIINCNRKSSRYAITPEDQNQTFSKMPDFPKKSTLVFPNAHGVIDAAIDSESNSVRNILKL